MSAGSGSDGKRVQKQEEMSVNAVADNNASMHKSLQPLAHNRLRYHPAHVCRPASGASEFFIFYFLLISFFISLLFGSELTKIKLTVFSSHEKPFRLDTGRYWQLSHCFRHCSMPRCFSRHTNRSPGSWIISTSPWPSKHKHTRNE